METKKEPLPFKEPAPQLKTTVILRPAFIDEYIEAVEQEGFWKKKKEGLRPETLAFLKEQKLEDIYWSRTKPKPKYDPVELYKYLEDKVPHKMLEEITIKSIDIDRLDELYIAGYFLPTAIPENCFAEREGSDTINIPANRKRKKKE